MLNPMMLRRNTQKRHKDATRMTEFRLGEDLSGPGLKLRLRVISDTQCGVRDEREIMRALLWFASVL